MERYRSGATERPQKRLQAVLAEETETWWNPQVRGKARYRAATFGELVISCRAYFGFGPEGSSDAGRMRDIMTAVSPAHADMILTARESGATDDDLHELVAWAIADAYFRQEGGGRAGLHVEFKDVDRLDISFYPDGIHGCYKTVYDCHAHHAEAGFPDTVSATIGRLA